MDNGNISRVVALTGGIGAGKSVVAKMLRAMGYNVYDCDIEARNIMNRSLDIKGAIVEKFGQECINSDGTLNRPAIGAIVFHDQEALTWLNNLVHGAVRCHLADYITSHGDELIFVETAILYQSGIDKMVDAVIEVVASEEIRAKRIMSRNGLTYNDAVARIEAQQFTPSEPHQCVYTLLNEGSNAIIPQLLQILQKLR